MPNEIFDKWWERAKSALKVYSVFWMTAVGGIVGANLGGVIGMTLFAKDLKAEYVMPWTHVGWYLGTGLFLFGATTGRMKMINVRKFGSESAGQDGGTETAPLVDENVDKSNDREVDDQQGWFSWLLGGGLAGGICGFFFGASLLVFYFSWAYSPWASLETIQSVEATVQRSPESGRFQSVFKTRHALPLLLCAGSTVLGAIGGATVMSIAYHRTRLQTQRKS